MQPDDLEIDEPWVELPDAPPHNNDWEEQSGKGQPDWQVFVGWYRDDTYKSPG